MSEDMTHYEGDGCEAPDAHGRHREAAEYLEQHKPAQEGGEAPTGGGDRVLGAAAGWVALNVPFGDDRQVNARRAFVAGARWAEARRPAPSRPEDRGAAEDLGSCSYLRGVGSCSFGCHSEPACITERPSGGWPSEPTPRDPAGEGEERCQECGHLLNGSAECHYTNEDGTDRWCSVGGCPCDTTRPSSPAGEGEEEHCGCEGFTTCRWCSHPLKAHAHRWCSMCHEEVRLRLPRWRRGAPAADHTFGCPHERTPAVPEPHTVGPEAVEEAWERIEETRDGHGVEVAVWRQSRPTWTDIRAVPIAVEDEIAHQFALEQYDILKARAERAEARATAAEAERDRLREALETADEAMAAAYGWLMDVDPQPRDYTAGSAPPVHADPVRQARKQIAAARRALAGESTGAGEGE